MEEPLLLEMLCCLETSSSAFVSLATCKGSFWFVFFVIVVHKILFRKGREIL